VGSAVEKIICPSELISMVSMRAMNANHTRWLSDGEWWCLEAEAVLDWSVD